MTVVVILALWTVAPLAIAALVTMVEEFRRQRHLNTRRAETVPAIARVAAEHVDDLGALMHQLAEGGAWIAATESAGWTRELEGEEYERPRRRRP